MNRSASLAEKKARDKEKRFRLSLSLLPAVVARLLPLSELFSSTLCRKKARRYISEFYCTFGAEEKRGAGSSQAGHGDWRRVAAGQQWRHRKNLLTRVFFSSLLPLGSHAHEASSPPASCGPRAGYGRRRPRRGGEGRGKAISLPVPAGAARARAPSSSGEPCCLRRRRRRRRCCCCYFACAFAALLLLKAAPPFDEEPFKEF